MSITEIESALSAMPPEELDRVEAILRRLRQKQLAREEQQLEEKTRFSAIPRRAGPMVSREAVQSIIEDEGI